MKRVGLAALAIGYLLLHSQPLVGQQVNEGNQTGLPPFGSFHGSNFDLVSLQNGNLHIQIPLISVKQRGRTFTQSFVYDIPTFEINWNPLPYPQSGFWTTYPADEISGWRIPDPYTWGASWTSGEVTCCLAHDPYTGACISYETTTYLTHYTVTDPDGTKHPTGVFKRQNDSTHCSVPQSVYTSPALDGTGIVLDISGQPETITLKDGTRVHPLEWRDSNGNLASFNSDMLGRQLLTTIESGTNYLILGIRDSNGILQPYRFDYADVTLNTDVCGPPYASQTCYEWSETRDLPIKLTLPNGQFYQFTWATNQTTWQHDLVRVDLPTGGYITYTYGTLKFVPPGSPRYSTWTARRRVTSRTVHDANGSATWLYAIGGVTNPDGSGEAHTLSYITIGSSTSSNRMETEVRAYSPTGTLMRTLTKDYAGDLDPITGKLQGLRVIRETTTLETGQSAKSETDFETFTYACKGGGQCTTSRLNPTERREFDYTGGLLRKTQYTYLHTNNQNYLSRNITDRVASVIVRDGGGNILTQTVNDYDNYVQGIQSTNAVRHDPAYNSSFTYRGNVTAVRRWRNTDSTWLETRHLQYDDVGNILSTKDPRGFVTAFNYDDSWGNTTCAPGSGSGRAYLKSATNPLGQAVNYTYNSCTGTIASRTDPNSQTTTFTYDFMDRPDITNFPGGGQTDLDYDDSNRIVAAKTKRSSTPLAYVVNRMHYDSLGRVWRTELCEDGTTSCSQSINTYTEFDALGRKSRVTNPTRCQSSIFPENCAAEPTFGITIFKYDGLNRTTRVIPPDGSEAADTNVIKTDYSGNSVTVTDQASKQRRSFTDALGRLIQVDEPALGMTNPTPGTGSVDITGIEQSAWVNEPFWGCILWDESGGCVQEGWVDNWHWVYDWGGVSITVNGQTKTATYSQGSTGSTIASDLTSAINADPVYPVTAWTAGSVVNLTSKATGTASNYPLFASSWTNDLANFSSPSFIPVPSGPTLTGGSDGVPSGSPSLATPAITTYTYNALDNLTNVLQSGSRQRTFTYNSLSQLLSATNPESGIISYTYDNNGNVLTKVSPKPNQTNPAVTITTNFVYDSLNRLTRKWYQNISTPEVNFFYDGASPSGVPGCTPTLGITNGIGRRTAMCDGAGFSGWTYDETGNVLAEQRKTNGVTKQISYDYNENGSMKWIQYPSGLKIDYGYDNAGRALEARDLAGSVNYATNATYSAAGGLCSLKNGASITSTFTFTNRLQPARLHVTSATPSWNPCDTPTGNGTIEDFTYAFNYGTANNGNVASVTNNRDTSRSLSYTYDELNRIDLAYTQATTGANCWGLDHSYDIWGNLLSITKKTDTHNACSPTLLTAGVNIKNQISDPGFVYDAAGNLTNTPNPGGLAMQYDAENRMTSTAGVTYTYDGDGQRVAKSSGKLYWYGSSSDPLFETDAAGNVTDEYIFFAGKRTARRKSPSGEINYYFADHLGSSRVVTSAAGSILDDSDFYPFGKEVPVLAASDNNYLFTGKERDAESGLDFFVARYYSYQFGRFLSPDEFTGGPVDAFSSNDPAQSDPLPYALISNPQSLNKYSYTWNNPLRYTDPNGHGVVDFLVGVGNSVVSNFTLGATPRNEPMNKDEAMGQAVGDLVSTGMGIYQMVQGSAVAGTGVAACATGAGCIVGAPVAAAGAAVAVHGAAVAGTAISNILTKSSRELRKEWEAYNGKPWPKDAATGRNQDVHHNRPRADGGSDNVRNIEPKTRKDHIDHHKRRGDFKRWGKRGNANKNQAEPKNDEKE